MASLHRSGKSSSDWSANELEAFHISVTEQDFATFFNLEPDAPPPTPRVPAGVLTALTCEEAADGSTFEFIRLMELAAMRSPKHESAVRDFTSHLLHTMGYLDGKSKEQWGVVQKHHVIQFTACDMTVDATPDVCIIDRSGCVRLLVREDRGVDDEHGQFDPEPKVIADAIAAFSRNDHQRRHHLGVPRLEEETIAAFTMDGIVPTFYKATITLDLLDGVHHGKFPRNATKILRHVTALDQEGDEDVLSIDSRKRILAAFEAFKQFVF
ncbi:hypothetical protein PLICRDRAFT_526262 [Plicaturopsis crispa FD-325 SS-3]|nr:hypothetical protein PLICRDRAFT_526262 [Plicaturopsis crispa FD-325 SS-3]